MDLRGPRGCNRWLGNPRLKLPSKTGIFTRLMRPAFPALATVQLLAKRNSRRCPLNLRTRFWKLDIFWRGLKIDIVPRESWQWPEYPCKCLLSLASSDRGQMSSVVILCSTGNNAVVGPQSEVCYWAPVSPNLWLGFDQIMRIICPNHFSLCGANTMALLSFLPHPNSWLLPKGSPVTLANQEPSVTGCSRLPWRQRRHTKPPQPGFRPCSLSPRTTDMWARLR